MARLLLSFVLSAFALVTIATEDVHDHSSSFRRDTHIGRQNHIRRSQHQHHRHGHSSHFGAEHSATPRGNDGFFPEMSDGLLGNSAGPTPQPQPATGSSGTVASNPAVQGVWKLTTRGNSGVSAQQMAVVDDDHVIIYDKVEHNRINTPNGNPAWGAIYTLSTAEVRPLQLTSNSFCAGGSFIGNGTMVSIGGNAARGDVGPGGPTWFNNTDGRQSIRLYTPCPKSNDCQPYEEPATHALLATRWYPSTVRMPDGSMMIIGGCANGGFTNDAGQNEASYEYFPRKSNQVVPSPFLMDTLTANLFPHAHLLPSGEVLMIANTKAMLYNPKTNTERRLPDMPNGVRVCYPFSGSSTLLPLRPENNYLAEILICGGSTINDQTPPNQLTSQIPASNQCARMVLNNKGIKAGWAVESMPQARHMHSMALLPTGQVVIVNGAQTGVSSYHSVQQQKGNSNADHPTFQPVLYDPQAAAGSRFSSQGMPTSQIARMYHSTAVLTPAGEVMISGSNPNGDIVSGSPYPSELSVEILSPPYASMPRATIAPLPTRVSHGQIFTVKITIPFPYSFSEITATLADSGFSTHGVQMNTRLVGLTVTQISPRGPTVTLRVQAPPTSKIYAPGYGWLYVLVDGVPTPGKRILIGDGTVPQGV